MTNTLYVHGPIIHGDGLAARQTVDGGLLVDFCSVDGGVADVQPDRIDVLVGHRGPPIGEVLHLEARDGRVFAVAEIDVDRIDADQLGTFADDTARWYWSPSLQPGTIDRQHIVDATITELSLTRSPASLGLDEVRFTSQRPHRLASLPMLRRAADTTAERRSRNGPLRINRVARGRAGDTMTLSYSRQPGRVLTVR